MSMDPVKSLLDLDAAEDTRVRGYLRALPEADAPDALLQRLLAARALPVKKQPQRWPWLATAAVLALGVLVAQSTRLLPVHDAGVPALASAPSHAAAAIDDPASRASLARIEAALSDAYDRNAADAEIDALSHARRGLIDSLATAAPAQLLQL